MGGSQAYWFKNGFKEDIEDDDIGEIGDTDEHFLHSRD